MFLKAVLAMIVIGTAVRAQTSGSDSFRAGAFAVDVTPNRFPVIINVGFLERIANQDHDRLYARALVMEKGAVRVAIVVVDSCMMPRELLDRAKEIARSRTGIPAENVLISATHTHSAPAAMGCLGSDADAEYPGLLPARIAEAIEQATRRLMPARAGWTTVDDFEHTHCRRWIFRSDRIKADPFGALTVRANMHPGYQNPDVIAPSGPVDPAISMLSLQSVDGKPIAMLANYSMHYFGSPAVSSDYYGLFSAAISRRAGAGIDGQPFVAIMSQGTSGDQMWMNYGEPKTDLTVQAYAEAVADVAWRAYQKIQYHSLPLLAMAETKISLRRRIPDTTRLSWAREIVAQMGHAKPRNQPEVYAREQIFLNDEPVRELKLQALRVGDLGITAIPNEVFAITGLKLKARSPLPTTFNIELANGAEGYIPPPEQHKLGGYTTWPARTAALEVEAEPKIVEGLLQLLEKVAGRSRRAPVESQGPYVRSVLASRPQAYWRMGEFSGTPALDLTGRQNGRYENGVAFFLPGPPSAAFSGKETNRAVHLAGGWFTSRLEQPGSAYSVEMWFWNGMPNDVRANTGHLMIWGGDKLSIGGQGSSPGRLRFSGIAGKTEVAPKTWNHVAVVRDGGMVRVYLNGKLEIDVAVPPEPAGELSIGGHQKGLDTLEGKIDEVAVYNRALKADEIVRRYKLSGL
jgi:hypothetical protein